MQALFTLFCFLLFFTLPSIADLVKHNNFITGHQCGHWQADYTELQLQIISGISPERVVVHYCPCGLADSLVGAVSTFYFALLSGRAFKLAGPYWSTAYTPRINWLIDPVQNQSSFIKRGFVESGVSLEDFKSSNLSNHHTKNIDKMFFITISGRVHYLFENPYHRKQLQMMGLRPETAFGCALDFLMKPKEEYILAQPEIWKAVSDPDVLVVGIQIRVGDTTFRSGSRPRLEDFEHFFNCSIEIEKTRSFPGQKVYWLFVSDSVVLRRLAQNRYGSKVLIPSFRGLVGNPDHVMKQNGGNRSGSSNAIILAAAENWLFAFSDFFAISLYSGYGRTAAFRGMGWRNMYFLNNKMKEFRSCAPGQHDDAFEVATKQAPGI